MTLSILIHVTHLLGVGHLTRAAALGRALAEAGHAVTIASGGMPAPLVRTGAADIAQLPPLRSDGLDFSRLLTAEGHPVDDGFWAARAAALQALVARLSPDIVITELYPFGRRGLRREIDHLLMLVRAHRPRTLLRPLILSSVRDILVCPTDSAKITAAHDKLRHYDAVLVHSDPRVVPLNASWPLDPALADKLIYTGYVDDRRPAPSDAATALIDRDLVLVSGGGSAASLPLYRAAIKAASLGPPRPWRLLIGYGVSQPEFDELTASAPPTVTVERARPDFPALLGACAVSISQAGYNTILDLAHARARAVVVPFEQGNETEQRLRAELFAARGLVTMLTEDRLTGQALADAVDAALAGPKPGTQSLDTDGTGATVAALERLARSMLSEAAP